MSANLRSLNLSGGTRVLPPSGGFTPGSVPFATAASVLGQDNANFFWDNTGKRLGIGTALPLAALTVSANTTVPTPTTGSLVHFVAANATNTTFLIDTFGANPSFIFRRSGGTAASPSATGSGLQIFNLQGRGYGATAYSTARIGFTGQASEAWTDTAQGSQLAFQTTANGTTSLLTRLFLGNNGLLAFGNGFTAAIPGLLPSGTELQARLADNSDYAPIGAKRYSVNGVAGATGSFTTVDLKTVTVTDGLITSIV